MSDVTAPATEMPKRPSGLVRFFKSIALLRESYIAMFGAFLVLF